MKRLQSRFSCVFLMLIMLATSSCATTIPTPSDKMTDDEFIEIVMRKCFQYFVEASDRKTGLVQDRANNSRPPSETPEKKYKIASVAATGYYLSAFVLAAERGWVHKREAEERTLNTLRYFANEIENVNGFYYHFVHMDTGERAWKSELSSIDTALFMGGVFTASNYFKDNKEIQKLTDQIYRRIDWQWMLNGKKYLSMGWKPIRNKPDGKFIEQYWDHYSESMIMYIMAIGSPTFPLSPQVWHDMHRPIKRYGKHVCIAYAPLFTHQYSHIWVDFRNKNDGNYDYFTNSVNATLANREFCIDMQELFPTYEEHVWGLTACDGPDGYKPYGGKPGFELHDGTVAPTAAGGSIAFTPELSKKALRTMYEKYTDRIWGYFGFCDSFNIKRDWFAEDVIAIDVGTMLLMMENERSGLMWEYFMKTKYIRKGMALIGFQPGSKEVKMPDPYEVIINKSKKEKQIDGDFSDWTLKDPLQISDMTVEYGHNKTEDDFKGNIYFQYDKKALYIAANIIDDEIRGRKGGDFIYKDDILEIYMDPDGDGLKWGDKNDLQFGISPSSKDETGKVRAYAWFQKKNPIETGEVEAKWVRTEKGYRLEAKVDFSVLLIKPKGKVRGSISFHDIDSREKAGTKVTG